MDRDIEHVEQPQAEQRLGQETVTVNEKISAVSLFELRYFGLDIAADDSRVVPIGPFQGRRETYFSIALSLPAQG